MLPLNLNNQSPTFPVQVVSTKTVKYLHYNRTKTIQNITEVYKTKEKYYQYTNILKIQIEAIIEYQEMFILIPISEKEMIKRQIKQQM